MRVATAWVPCFFNLSCGARFLFLFLAFFSVLHSNAHHELILRRKQKRLANRYMVDIYRNKQELKFANLVHG